MKFSGERFVPHATDRDIKIEHMQRYYSVVDLVKDKIVLDAACGEGYGTYLLSQNAAHVTGLDISSEAIVHAKLTYVKENISFVQGSIENLPLPDQSVDVVISFETIEHVDESAQKRFLQEIKRVLKSDGLLIMSTPDKYIYSERPKYKNSFHIREFYKNEYYEFLKQFFNKVDIYNQSFEVASFILNNQSDVAKRIHIETNDHVVNGKYLIAVCSDHSISHVNLNTFIPEHQDKFFQMMQRIVSLQDEVEERNAHIKHLDSVIFEKDQQIRLLQNHVEERNAHFKHLDNAIIEKDQQIALLQNHLEEKDTRIKHLESIVLSKEQQINQLDNIILDKNQLLNLWQDRYHEKDERIRELESRAADVKEHIRNLESALINKENYIDQLEHNISHKDEHLNRLEDLLASKEHHLNNLIEQLQFLKDQLSQKNTLVNEILKIANQNIGVFDYIQKFTRENEERITYALQNVASHEEKLHKISEELQAKDQIIVSMHDWHMDINTKVTEFNQNFKKELEEKDRVIKDQVSHINTLLEQERKLNNILNSDGWKALSKYYKYRDLLFPNNSKRRLVAKMTFKALKNPRQVLKRINKDNIRKLKYYLKTEDPSLLESRIENYLDRHSNIENNRDLQVYHEQDTTKKLVFPVFEIPKVSIIIPVYNQWNFTYGCLKSILENTSDVSYEVIVADDMSTDETVRIQEFVEKIGRASCRERV